MKGVNRTQVFSLCEGVYIDTLVRIIVYTLLLGRKRGGSQKAFIALLQLIVRLPRRRFMRLLMALVVMAFI